MRCLKGFILLSLAVLISCAPEHTDPGSSLRAYEGIAKLLGPVEGKYFVVCLKDPQNTHGPYTLDQLNDPALQPCDGSSRTEESYAGSVTVNYRGDFGDRTFTFDLRGKPEAMRSECRAIASGFRLHYFRSVSQINGVKVSSAMGLHNLRSDGIELACNVFVAMIATGYCKGNSCPKKNDAGEEIFRGGVTLHQHSDGGDNSFAFYAMGTKNDMTRSCRQTLLTAKTHYVRSVTHIRDQPQNPVISMGNMHVSQVDSLCTQLVNMAIRP